MSKSIMAPARFRDKAHRARHELEHVMWHISEIEDAAGEGDERCKQFISEHSSGIRAMHHCRETWRGDALRIIDEVEENTAKRDGKVFCDVCRKNVKNISDHRRRSSSHKGRVRVQELDKDPNWKRMSQDTKEVVETMLAASGPSGTGGSPEYQWNNDQKLEHQRLLKDRLEGLSDIILIQPYNYHSSGRENRWGHDSGKYWVSPHIDKHAHHLMSIIHGIRSEHSIPRYGTGHGGVLCREFQKIVDPIIRNPNDIVRHAAMYALQLNRED